MVLRSPAGAGLSAVGLPDRPTRQTRRRPAAPPGRTSRSAWTTRRRDHRAAAAPMRPRCRSDRAFQHSRATVRPLDPAARQGQPFRTRPAAAGPGREPPPPPTSGAAGLRNLRRRLPRTPHRRPRRSPSARSPPASVVEARSARPDLHVKTGDNLDAIARETGHHSASPGRRQRPEVALQPPARTRA